ncbi:hypothetical protein D9M69_624140 [compost metagenome]
MRYVGQGHEIAIPASKHRLTDADVALLGRSFESAYIKLFGRAIPGAQVEILTWSVLVTTHPEASAPSADAAVSHTPPIPTGHRDYFDGSTAQRIAIPVFERAQLHMGQLIQGPALITEPQTTTYVSASFGAQVDRHGNLVLDRQLKTQVNA